MKTQTNTIDYPTNSNEVQEKSLTEHQIRLEQLFNKNQLHKRIREEFLDANSDEMPFLGVMEANKIPHTFGFDLLVQMVLHKRAPVTSIVGAMRRHYGCVQQTADMIRTCVEAGLVTYDPNLRLLITNFVIPDEVQAELDRFQFPLPMVVPPRKLQSNKDSGYLMSGSSVVLRDNHTDDDVCLDHLDRVNSIAFTINHDVVKMVKNTWRNLGRQKPDETREDFARRLKAFDKFDRTSKDVISTLTALSEEHFLTHRYDKRGRTYCMGYHINLQGNAWDKAISELADKELVV